MHTTPYLRTYAGHALRAILVTAGTGFIGVNLVHHLLKRGLGWRPAETFATGISKTVHWYLDHPDWVADIKAGTYRGERLGLSR